MIDGNKRIAVIFDMDGTILDTERIYQKYWRIAAEELGYKLKDEDYLGLRSLGHAFAPGRFLEMTGGKDIPRQAIPREAVISRIISAAVSLSRQFASSLPNSSFIRWKRSILSSTASISACISGIMRRRYSSKYCLV